MSNVTDRKVAELSDILLRPHLKILVTSTQLSSVVNTGLNSRCLADAHAPMIDQSRDSRHSNSERNFVDHMAFSAKRISSTGILQGTSSMVQPLGHIRGERVQTLRQISHSPGDVHDSSELPCIFVPLSHDGLGCLMLGVVRLERYIPSFVLRRVATVVVWICDGRRIRIPTWPSSTMSRLPSGNTSQLGEGRQTPKIQRSRRFPGREIRRETRMGQPVESLRLPPTLSGLIGTGKGYSSEPVSQED
ncbi:hypothetical protein BDV38DRAFT_289077 [Aspergillus pseudotamarii]|uniref:Uncharacterized protein n=1 Tax=Aspergillus pseudotamarii TaxID=132259 RepID=A0A5N6SD67_ASPPS|nr:uncharacterized protein BDV38DRAFT_289077 [Aspergillus pseudotamarii]KAE8131054.1 hypothetical protein BDV38DRAFT_289077 [Aspergillus pseudotamarii]